MSDAEYSVTIRNAQSADVDDAVRLLQHQLEDHAIPTRAVALRRQVLAMIEHPTDGFVLIAEAQGQKVGVAYVSFARPLEHDGQVAWLEELFVESAMRSHGVGRALVRAVLARAEDHGCVAVDLEVADDHERASHLYAREGFRPMKRSHWTRPLTAWDWGNLFTRPTTGGDS